MKKVFAIVILISGAGVLYGGDLSYVYVRLFTNGGVDEMSARSYINRELHTLSDVEVTDDQRFADWHLIITLAQNTGQQDDKQTYTGTIFVLGKLREPVVRIVPEEYKARLEAAIEKYVELFPERQAHAMELKERSAQTREALPSRRMLHHLIDPSIPESINNHDLQNICEKIVKVFDSVFSASTNSGLYIQSR